MTTDKKPRPDGYCAWHPEKGYQLSTFSPEYQGGQSVGDSAWGNCSFRLNDSLAIQSRSGIHASKLGWQIKPVWLSDTPPVPKEVLGLMIKYITHLMDESGTIHPMLSEEELKKLRSYIKPEGE